MPIDSYPLIVAQTFSDTLSGFWEFVEPRWQSFKSVLIGEDLLIQLSVVGGAFVLSYVLMIGLRPMFKKLTEAIEQRDDWVESAVDWLSENLFSFLLVGLLWSASIWFDAYNDSQAALEAGVSVENLRQVEQPLPSVGEPQAVAGAKNYILIRAMASLVTLILVSRALPKAIRQRTYYRTLFFILAVVLILNLLGLWQGLRVGMDKMQILPIADGDSTRVTVLTLLKGILVILIIIPLTNWLMGLSERRVRSVGTLTPALQMLIVKVVKALVFVTAILFGISSVGIDLSALTVFGGAIGLGLGFGFQKVVSNLVSGVILLSDRSIKPGDVIEVDDTYGWINKLSARYVSVITRDGMEHLIPNETLITEKVTNWSFSDDKVRVKIPFGVSYNSNVHKVMELAIEAAKSVPRVLSEKDPVCWMLGFGDNSVDFELRVWIRDPANGLNNLRSSIYVKLWDLFQEHGIEIPFPQRDLHLRGGSPIEVSIQDHRKNQGD